MPCKASEISVLLPAARQDDAEDGLRQRLQFPRAEDTHLAVCPDDGSAEAVRSLFPVAGPFRL